MSTSQTENQAITYMRSIKILTFFLASFLLLLWAGSSKAGFGAPTHPTAALLMDGTWHLTGWKIITGADTVDKRSRLLACQRDDRFRFTPTGVLVCSEGPLACSGSQPRATVSIRSWNLDASGTKLTISAGGAGVSSATYTVEQLTADALRLRYARVVDGVPVIEILSYLN